jgi:hypothetical protein
MEPYWRLNRALREAGVGARLLPEGLAQLGQRVVNIQKDDRPKQAQHYLYAAPETFLT